MTTFTSLQQKPSRGNLLVSGLSCRDGDVEDEDDEKDDSEIVLR